LKRVVSSIRLDIGVFSFFQATYGQLDLEVISSLSQIKRRPFNFHEFWSEKLHYENKDFDV
jgi:hypothetical protein